MQGMDKYINQVITALFELEAKGCHSVFFEYGNRTIHVRIFKGAVREKNVVFEKNINMTQEEYSELEEVCKHIDNMKNFVYKTVFQCYKREFIKGVKVGEWKKTRPFFEFGKNATQEMLINYSGCYITDPDNSMQYFVDYNCLSETE